MASLAFAIVGAFCVVTVFSWGLCAGIWAERLTIRRINASQKVALYIGPKGAWKRVG